MPATAVIPRRLSARWGGSMPTAKPPGESYAICARRYTSCCPRTLSARRIILDYNILRYTAI